MRAGGKGEMGDMPGRYRDHPYVPARDPLGAIPPSRHPFQFWMMFALVLGGLGNLLTPGSEVLQQGLDPFFHKLWAIVMISGGAIAIVAAWWRDRITGLLLERIALISVGLMAPVYSGALVLSTTDFEAASLTAAFTTSAGLASLWRAAHVSRELKKLRYFVARHFS